MHERLQEILKVHTFVQNDFDSEFITKPVGSVTTAVQFDVSSSENLSNELNTEVVY